MVRPLFPIMILSVLLNTRAQLSKNLLEYWQQYPHTILISIITSFFFSILTFLFTVFISTITTTSTTTATKSTCKRHHCGNNKVMSEKSDHKHKSQKHEPKIYQIIKHNIATHNTKQNHSGSITQRSQCCNLALILDVMPPRRSLETRMKYKPEYFFFTSMNAHDNIIHGSHRLEWKTSPTIRATNESPDSTTTKTTTRKHKRSIEQKGKCRLLEIG